MWIRFGGGESSLAAASSIDLLLENTRTRSSEMSNSYIKFHDTLTCSINTAVPVCLLVNIGSFLSLTVSVSLVDTFAVFIRSSNTISHSLLFLTRKNEVQLHDLRARPA